IRAIRILIGIAAFYDYVIWKMDVKTVFLNEKYVSFKDPFMDLSKHQEAGTKDLMRKSKGSIMYAFRCTRPDVAFTQNITSYFQQNPAELRVTCYCDAGFETDRDDITSQTRYVFILNGGAVD
ncbi:hypothetical protein Tco_1534567, partial [Tanacetum coccineum]